MLSESVQQRRGRIEADPVTRPLLTDSVDTRTLGATAGLAGNDNRAERVGFCPSEWDSVRCTRAGL